MTPATPFVAICARDDAPTLEECRAALYTAGANPHEFRAAHGRGLAEARNAALVAAASAEVLAMVEDDVIVTPDWLNALTSAWRDADAACGCIGAHLLPQFAPTRPPWLSDEHLGVLGAPPGGATFPGGTLSFRVEALRGIGGFWPARGDVRLRDWFTEEHYAQHQLAAAGWTSHALPGSVAMRVVDCDRLTRRSLLGKRARYGARAALIGTRIAATAAARDAVRGTAGAVAATARGNQRLAMDRAGRALENGARLGPRLLTDSALEPDRTETPFLYHVPAPTPRVTRFRRPARRTTPLVLVYHRVDDAPGTAVSTEVFAQQVAALVERRTPVPVDQIACGEAPPDAVAVTFDDAYAETLENVAPILAASRIPATMFVVTARAADQLPFWWDELDALLALGSGSMLRLTVDGERRAWADASRAAMHIRSWLHPKSPESIQRAMSDLRTWAGVDTALTRDEHRPASIDELRAASSRLLTFGAHSRTHRNLRFASPATRRRELRGSREDLSAWLGKAPPGLAYPFGIRGADVDRATRDAAEEAGFAYALINQAGVIDKRTDRLAVPRSAAPAEVGPDFANLIAS